MLENLSAHLTAVAALKPDLLSVAKYSDEVISWSGRLARCGVGILPARWAGAGRSRDSGQDARGTQLIVTIFCNSQ
jgi:hypothetical protein